MCFLLLHIYSKNTKQIRLKTIYLEVLYSGKFRLYKVFNSVFEVLTYHGIRRSFRKEKLGETAQDKYRNIFG